MPERTFPTVRVRPVRGRVVDPFRGTPADEDGDGGRFEPRAVDAQPLDEVVAVLARLPGVKLVRAGRRFTLGRGHDVLRIAFASAARRVSLDDATFEGDGNLVVTALHALLPLFGAVEVRVGDDYRDLIDGHEPLATVLERFDAWWIASSLELAQQLAARDAARAQARAGAVAPPAGARAAARARRASRRLRIAFAVVVLVLAVALGVGIVRSRKAEVGASCTENAACESHQCLPREPLQTYALGGVELGRYTPPPPPRDPSGVCTRACYTDADCPDAMRCGDVMSYGTLGIGTRRTSCIPRAWQ